MKRSQRAVCAALAGLALFFGGAAIKSDAQTIHIAVYGDNLTDELINLMNPPVPHGETFGLTNYRAELLTTNDILAGALERTTNPFSAFFYTRNTGSRAANLAGEAYNKVHNFVRRSDGSLGSVVLFNGDFADALTAVGNPGFPAVVHDPVVMRLIANAVIYAAASGHGFIGEQLGALAALTSNEDSMSSFNFVAGHAKRTEFGGGAGAEGEIVVDPRGVGHPLFAGWPEGPDPDDPSKTIPLPYDPTPGTQSSVEFGAEIQGVDPSLSLAGWLVGFDPRTGDPIYNPAIIVQAARPAQEAIPEPGSLALLGTGLLAMGGYLRRRGAR